MKNVLHITSIIALIAINTAFGASPERLFTDLRESLDNLPALYQHSKKETLTQFAQTEHQFLSVLALRTSTDAAPITKGVAQHFAQFYAQLSGTDMHTLTSGTARNLSFQLEKLSKKIAQAVYHGLPVEHARTMLEVNSTMHTLLTPTWYLHGKFGKEALQAVSLYLRKHPIHTGITSALVIGLIVALTMRK